MLCTHTATAGEIAVLDPDTRQQRWSLDGWTNLGPLDHHDRGFTCRDGDFGTHTVVTPRPPGDSSRGRLPR
jgi:hypothetical protein